MNTHLLNATIDKMPDEQDIDQTMLLNFISSAISYAECFQRLPYGTYSMRPLRAETENAIVMMAIYFYKTRFGFSDGVKKGLAAWNEFNALLHINSNWGFGLQAVQS